MPRYQRPVINFQADDVWAAAARAQRINGGYVKYINPELRGADAVPTTTNRELVEQFLADTSVLADEDRAMGETIRRHYQGLTFKILQGIKLSEFSNNAMLIANRDTVTNTQEIGVITCLPGCYEKDLVRKTVDDRIAESTRSHLGKIGQKITAKAEVVRCVYSMQWNTNYITAITESGHAIFFSFRANLEVGSTVTVSGKVKAHRDGFQTQLNYAKIG